MLVGCWTKDDDGAWCRRVEVLGDWDGIQDAPGDARDGLGGTDMVVVLDLDQQQVAQHEQTVGST